LISARSLDPKGAAAIFAVAWLAGFAGSLAALLIAVALFAGFYGARVVASANVAAESPAPAAEPSTVSTVHAGEAMPSLREALADGLVVRKIELGQAPVAKSRKSA
jgi:hypothetical protein